MTMVTEDKRLFSRILFDAPVDITTEGHHWESYLIDISLKGALVKKPENWLAEHEHPVDLNVQIGESSEICIRMHTNVAHQNEKMIGLKCEQIDLESAANLKRLVELNLSDQRLLERELGALSEH